MPVAVFKAFSIVEGELLEEDAPSSRSRFKLGDIAAVLTALEARGDGPAWAFHLLIGTGPGSREMAIPLRQFLTAEEYRRSFAEPFSFAEVGAMLDPKTISDPTLRWLWLYRDGIYATERSPRSSEMGEVALRVKSLHFQEDQALRRLKEQVANFEAIDTNLKAAGHRTAIPDDVKLLVWSRDGGACVKCGTTEELQFDHIIPYARGGSDAAANIQILCRSCNLAKSDRLL